jgi:hypothetical protein
MLSMKPPSQARCSGAGESQQSEQSAPKPFEPPLEPKLGAVNTFISLAEQPRTPEERRARIEAVLKTLGLPNLDELNRMDREANARANQGLPKDDTA